MDKMSKLNNRIMVFVVQDCDERDKKHSEDFFMVFRTIAAQYNENDERRCSIAISHINTMETLKEATDILLCTPKIDDRKTAEWKYDEFLSDLRRLVDDNYEYSKMYSTRCIKSIHNTMVNEYSEKDTLHFVFVHTKSINEIDQLYKEIGIDGMIYFNTRPIIYEEDDIRRYFVQTWANIMNFPKQILQTAITKVTAVVQGGIVFTIAKEKLRDIGAVAEDVEST